MPDDAMAYFLAALGAIPGFAGLIVALRKSDTDRAKFMNDAAMALIEPLKSRIMVQDLTIAELLRENAALRRMLAENKKQGD
jgi:hypothetical protein